MYNMGTVLELDDGNNYAIASNVDYQNKKYLYLVDIDNNSNLMFCEIQNEELVFVSDTELIKQLILIVNDSIN